MKYTGYLDFSFVKIFFSSIVISAIVLSCDARVKIS